MTALQLDPSAQAPWTSTMLGCSLIAVSPRIGHVVSKRYYNPQARARAAAKSAAVAVHHEAAAHDRLGVVHVDVLAALRAHDADGDALAAGLVQEVDWRGREIGPLVPPLHERCVD